MPRPLSGLRCLCAAAALLAAPHVIAAEEPITSFELVGPSLRGQALELDSEVRTLLNKRQWPEAAAALRSMDLEEMSGLQRGDYAFLLTWVLHRAGQTAKAEGHLPLLMTSESAPAGYVDLMAGRVQRAIGDDLGALESFERVPDGGTASPFAAMERAEVLRELGRTAEGWAVYEQLVQRPDPALGGSTALWALVQRQGVASEASIEPMARIWTYYPRSEEAGDAAAGLASHGWRSSWREAGIRAEILMDRYEYRGALALVAGRADQVDAADVDACRLLYVLGRMQFKLGQLSAAESSLGDIGERCEDVRPGYGARGLYLKAKAQAELGKHTAAIATYREIPARYPGHQFADDGYTEAADLLLKSGDEEAARALLFQAAEAEPQGDTVADGLFGLAFQAYLAGDGEEARQLAAVAAAIPAHGDWVDVLAARYWLARWTLYPDVDDPRRAVDDPTARATAVGVWEALCQQHPQSYYAILAYARLRELAPEVAASVSARPQGWSPADASGPWKVRSEVLADPRIADGVALARLGLGSDSLALLSSVERTELLPDEMAWLTELRASTGDWLKAHDAMRKWLRVHPPGTLGANEADVIRVGYPNRYWDEVLVATEPYSRYEPRLFHALVREESNYNRTIRSHAGARGLSQLMPATAKETAGWIGLKITMDKLDDPATNLAIGAKYFDVVHRQAAGSPFLALAGYNAGLGRVKRWLGEWGNVPTDEYVERIPFSETRAYVKRVMGTWQTMRWAVDDGPVYYDLSRYNAYAKPDNSG